MRHLITAAMLLAVTAVPASAQVSIDFEGMGAPCLFVSTGPLTTQYSGQGVTFGGNGSILNQCGGWLTGPAHSGTDFAGYNSNVRPASESIVFSSTQSFFDVFVGSSSSATFTYYLGGSVVSSSTQSFSVNAWTQVTHAGDFDRVDITSANGFFQLDDLNTQAAIVTPEPATMTLFATGLFGLGVIARRRQRRSA